MKNTFKQLQKAIRLINECNSEIDNAKHLPYYKAYGREEELDNDIAHLKQRINSLELEKQDLIDKMQQELETLKSTHANAA
jgi:DNA repair exonuclease SbcCD ATPase subunit